MGFQSFAKLGQRAGAPRVLLSLQLQDSAIVNSRIDIHVVYLVI
jgi:hypothetical protein